MTRKRKKVDQEITLGDDIVSLTSGHLEWSCTSSKSYGIVKITDNQFYWIIPKRPRDD